VAVYILGAEYDLKLDAETCVIVGLFWLAAMVVVGVILKFRYRPTR
jgi:hypothetical protein